MRAPTKSALAIYPPTIPVRDMGDEKKSLSILVALSFTRVPNAPSVVVTDVTARIPAINHAFNRFFFDGKSGKLSDVMSAKKSTYKAIRMKTDSIEKKTVVLSRK
ncbi:hypothetical protein OXB_2514 [Bacillus sp. OxB-1]|nr:hypothetical protein OXB_2514 [Bacillus sp. OxB-1]